MDVVSFNCHNASNFYESKINIITDMIGSRPVMSVFLVENTQLHYLQAFANSEVVYYYTCIQVYRIDKKR